MKKHITLAAVLALATGNLFAFGALPLDTNKDKANEVGSILSIQKEKQDNAQKVEYISGVFMKGSINRTNSKVDFAEKNLNITFTEDGKGNIVYKIVKTNKFETADINMKSEADYRSTNLEDCTDAVFAIVTLLDKNNKELQTSKIYITTVETQSLTSSAPARSSYDRNYPLPEKDAKGNCARCGAADPYHCNEAGIGPCDGSKKAAAPAKKTAEAVKDHSDCDRYHCKYNGYVGPCEDDKVYDYKGPAEKNHAKDCKDPYHCDCPEVGAAPVKKATSAKVPTKVITETVKIHNADCVDQYHCDCPTKDVKRTVAKELVEEKVHNADCVDKYHCNCPTKQVYR